MFTLCEKQEKGVGEYAGIPVLSFDLSIPVIEDDKVKQVQRINSYYDRLLSAELSYAKGALTKIAGTDFDQSMENSRIFQPFTLKNTFTYEWDEDHRLLTIQCKLQALLGQWGDFTQCFSDLWDMNDGLPGYLIPKATAGI